MRKKQIDSEIEGLTSSESEIEDLSVEVPRYARKKQHAKLTEAQPQAGPSHAHVLADPLSNIDELTGSDALRVAENLAREAIAENAAFREQLRETTETLNQQRTLIEELLRQQRHGAQGARTAQAPAPTTQDQVQVEDRYKQAGATTSSRGA
ncbi:hypothetical protein FISHEDRAFT_55872 [Fistulina hepatica ATCC 64428]|uniref:Uncharacterized protein n=1 Tax=Fistulina hepatica ATCC 64428 TaxID=1128425 RepID=A0A0D7ALB3_9AGAR|nr:hypothetical protein FISHEDRAFT_55872 [Fistulina hepatica ATCC 64428]